jgi:hypothetical protein
MAKSNMELPDLDTCIERLKLVSKQTSASAVMRWLGLPASTYSNWKRRKSMNYDRVIEGLLRQGVSLDWLFAPNVDLYYPNVSLIVTEQDEVKYSAPSVADTMKALQYVEPIMKKHNVPMTEANHQFMTEAYFKRRGDAMLLDTALQQVALALATAQKATDNN